MRVNPLSMHEQPVMVAPELAKVLKPHQVGGVRFMWYNICGVLADYNKKESELGCILAHSMGLGKTLQVCRQKPKEKGGGMRKKKEERRRRRR